jgi:hypothetical protein
MKNVFTTLGTLKILEIKDNADGTANVEFDISDEFKKNIIEKFGWSEWSDEKFQKLVLEALELAIKNKPVDRIED